MKQSEVIAELKGLIVNQIDLIHTFHEEDSERLALSPGADAWNVLQCLEHLNRYAEFYTNEIESILQKKPAKLNRTDKELTPGYWGKKFCDSMLPDENGKIKKMNTFKSKNPTAQEASIDSLDKFLAYQERWEKILEKVKEFDLNKNKCKLTIPIIKMNLGSTLLFVIYHQERHMQQAKKALQLAVA